MQKSREVQLSSGKRFLVAQLPAMRALKLFNRLVSTAGPAFASVASSVENLADLEVAKLGDALKMLLDQLTPDAMESLLRELFATVQVYADDGSQISPVMPVFDNTFSGDIGGVLELAKHALEVNYGNFLGALLGRAKASRPAVKASNSGVSNISSGPSGA